MHQLFYHHGKSCGRCKPEAREGSEEWKYARCPLEHLKKVDFKKAMANRKKMLVKKAKKMIGKEEVKVYVEDEEVAEYEEE